MWIILYCLWNAMRTIITKRFYRNNIDASLTRGSHVNFSINKRIYRVQYYLRAPWGYFLDTETARVQTNNVNTRHAAFRMFR